MSMPVSATVFFVVFLGILSLLFLAGQILALAARHRKKKAP